MSKAQIIAKLVGAGQEDLAEELLSATDESVEREFFNKKLRGADKALTDLARSAKSWSDLLDTFLRNKAISPEMNKALGLLVKNLEAGASKLDASAKMTKMLLRGNIKASADLVEAANDPIVSDLMRLGRWTNDHPSLAAKAAARKIAESISGLMLDPAFDDEEDLDGFIDKTVKETAKILQTWGKKVIQTK
jgi:hypothetical protein